MHRATRLREGSGGPISTLVGIRLRTHLSDCWRWVLLAALLALLPGWTDAAGSQAQVLRAGSGLRANEVQAHHLTRKAVCSGTFLGQSPLFKGEWVAHEEPSFHGFYNKAKECPSWVQGWDCQADGTDHRDMLDKEYNQVYKPFVCDMRQWDLQEFAKCTANRRMIMVGDMSMQQMFNSLACLTRPALKSGKQTPWEESDLKLDKEYTARSLQPGLHVKKKFVGDFLLDNGLHVFLRSFNVFNLTLWDDVMKPFGELQADDILVVNFGAWYPRYSVLDPHHPWPAWQKDMKELLMERLAGYKARTFWRSYAAAHYGGTNGTNTFEEEAAKELKAGGVCPATKLGESWYEEYVRAFLRKCGTKCSHVSLLPVFQLTVGRPNSHMGSFGHGKDGHNLDCRMYCSNVVDQWNVLLFNLLC
ncbi:hypothetical protein COCSUDRAFT_66960 [Coccomyxa subellipsoidea C-169]|uniref:Trichome birefringence-like C-terminal domain-containing protein n=1 Tax=Coccomyxa subellipsoidea (strain C-169) TaxID=574566 RepID=I0YT69_COCSC|nr:hypothetical protein COCSUDRAFT_66960 [Coccomyxa subellipsoidea C-169]EIE21588.1 hypothetical protein COCSUDRAFT_66960 [Coccomyxa subellipsoidea C-169]|eukprot:XP_005646132.1 hypothetical protein COCSUDRAFT_66960 [Coccomyxa subellipsoidea C-169]